MRNPFKIFYTTPIEFGRTSGGGSYSNPDGVFKLLGREMADVQPCSGSLAQKDYGLSEKVDKRAFCSAVDYLKAGDSAVIDGVRHEVIYIEEWELGSVLLLRKAI